MRIHSKRLLWLLAAIFVLPILALTLTAQQTNSLSIAGEQGTARVIQVGGRNYVDVEGLARLTNASLNFSGNQIILTLPGSGSSTSALAPTAPPRGLSKDYVTAGIEAMAQIREWHTVLRGAIERALPLSSDWLGPYREQAREALRLASVAITTDADRNAYPYLTQEFNNMSALTDKYLGMAQSMTRIDPGALVNDPLDQKIRACAHSLASMATTNQWADDGSCQ